ncbi:MAG: hypothetical protein ACOCYB_09575 [Alkalispirochaeta sp.]
MITILVTGEPGTGKTSLLINLSKRLGVVGVISRPRVDEFGKRTGIVATFPDTGERIELATVVRIPGDPRVAGLVAAPSTPGGADDDSRAAGSNAHVMVGPWRFSRGAIADVNARLARIAEEAVRGGATSDAAHRSMPVVVIDEIGPLELLRHGGFLPGLEAVMRSALPAIVVVRPALVAELRRTIGSFSESRSPNRLHTVSISHPAQIEPTARRILAMLQGL